MKAESGYIIYIAHTNTTNKWRTTIQSQICPTPKVYFSPLYQVPAKGKKHEDREMAYSGK